MRVVSFSADGLREAAREGFYDWALDQDADVICVQDMRCEERQLPDKPFFPDGYHAYFLDSPDGVNGVGIYTRALPKAIMTGLGLGQADIEARYIQADFVDLSVCSVLAPSAVTDQLESREAFLRQLRQTLDKVRNKRRQYILCGNWQVAHKDIDRRQALEDPEGSAWFDGLFELGYVDAFRSVRDDADEFSWWPDGRDGAQALRADLQIVSGSLADRVEHGAYYTRQAFSTHAPLVLDYDLELKGV
jgi:exodeoxyribonuclease-3